MGPAYLKEKDELSLSQWFRLGPECLPRLLVEKLF